MSFPPKIVQSQVEYISRKGKWDGYERVQAKDEMTEVEKRLGRYLEEYPQEARQAIETLVKKGYMIGVVQDYQWSSRYGAIRLMQIHHDLSPSTVDALRHIGVKVKMYSDKPEDQVGGLTEIGFRPDEPDQQQITEMWNTIAEVLPDQGHMPNLEACIKLREEIQHTSQQLEATGASSLTAADELFGYENKGDTGRNKMSLMSILQTLLKILSKKSPL